MGRGGLRVAAVKRIGLGVFGRQRSGSRKTDSQRTRGKSHRVIVQDLEDWEKVDVDAQVGGRDSQTP